MQAVTTKYLAATNSHGSRVLAKCQAKRMIVPWDDSIGIEENHTAAGMQLIAYMGWTHHGAWAAGALPDGSGFALVCTPNES